MCLHNMVTDLQEYASQERQAQESCTVFGWHIVDTDTDSYFSPFDAIK